MLTKTQAKQIDDLLSEVVKALGMNAVKSVQVARASLAQATEGRMLTRQLELAQRREVLPRCAHDRTLMDWSVRSARAAVWLSFGGAGTGIRRRMMASSKTRQPIARVTDAEIPAKTDGCGNALIAEADYYVQDCRTLVGNCISWWRPKGDGYCCDLNDAGVYKGSDVAGMRGTDVPWPAEYVRARTVVHVRGDNQAFDRGRYNPGPRS